MVYLALRTLPQEPLELDGQPPSPYLDCELTQDNNSVDYYYRIQYMRRPNQPLQRNQRLEVSQQQLVEHRARHLVLYHCYEDKRGALRLFRSFLFSFLLILVTMIQH